MGLLWKEPGASFRENDFLDAEPLLSQEILGRSPPGVFKKQASDLEPISTWNSP